MADRSKECDGDWSPMNRVWTMRRDGSQGHRPHQSGGRGIVGGQRDWCCRVEAWGEDEERPSHLRQPLPPSPAPALLAVKSIRPLSQELPLNALPCGPKGTQQK